MRKKIVCWILSAALLLSGCAAARGGGEEGRYVYRLDKHDAMVTERVKIDDPQQALTELARALNASPKGEGLRRVFPDGVWIRGCEQYNGHVRVDMNDVYVTLSQREQKRCDAAVAYTLMQLDEVQAVDILHGSRVLRYGVTAQSAVISDRQGETLCPVKLFVPDFDKPGLVSRTVLLETGGTEEVWALTARALLEEADWLPEDTQLRDIRCEDGQCVLTLSQELYTTEPELSYNARLVIGSFVNTLCHLEGVDTVTIRVGGSPMASYGTLMTVWPMSFDRSLLS